MSIKKKESTDWSFIRAYILAMVVGLMFNLGMLLLGTLFQAPFLMVLLGSCIVGSAYAFVIGRMAEKYFILMKKEVKNGRRKN